MIEYTKEEFKQFKRLVEMQESPIQITRITGRLDMQKFIEKVGKEKCDVMFTDLCKK
jgi:hypothetical protein